MSRSSDRYRQDKYDEEAPKPYTPPGYRQYSFSDNYSDKKSNSNQFNQSSTLQSSKSSQFQQQLRSAQNVPIEQIILSIEEKKGKKASGIFAKNTLQMIVLQSKNNQAIFGTDAKNVEQTVSKITQQQFRIYLPSLIASFTSAIMFNKKFPTPPIGRWKIRRFLKIFSVYTLATAIFSPLFFRIFQSNSLGQQAKQIILRHSDALNSPNLSHFAFLKRQNRQKDL